MRKTGGKQEENRRKTVGKQEENWRKTGRKQEENREKTGGNRKKTGRKQDVHNKQGWSGGGGQFRARDSFNPTFRPNLQPNSEDSLCHEIDSCKIFGSKESGPMK